MKRWSTAPFVVAVLFLVLAQATQASHGPKWTDEQLSAFSDAIVTGRVVDLSSGWDPAVDTIYTYVTIDVAEVLKGDLAPGLLTIKQLGGVAGEMGLSVIDQASFQRGEEVLLFLEGRPRDRSLYTAALWQGKWNLETTANGDRAARRREPGFASVFDRRSLDSIRASVASAGVGRGTGALNTLPVDALAANPQPFVFMDPPWRYSFSPPVDIQSGGQPGLAGGGAAEIQASINRWNSAGSSFLYTAGGTVGPRCTTQILNNSRVTISFMDPCGEMSNVGGILALGGSYYFTSGGTTVNGQLFRRAAEGFVVNNDSATALNFLRQSGCFADVQLHELGHVLGLGHSADNRAIMFPTINNSCTSGPTGLGVDDLQGLLFIYPGSGGGTTPPGSAPGNVQVTVSGTSSLTVSWSAVTAFSAESLPLAATSYRLDFRATPTGPVIQPVPATGTSITVAIPPGISGTFYVAVTGINSAGAGPSSPSVAFTIGGGGGGCTTAPATPTGVSGGITSGTATVQWTASPGATSYIVQAGSAQGGSNLFNANVGPLTTVTASGLPPGFRAFVRIIAVNACGQSAPTADFTLQ